MELNFIKIENSFNKKDSSSTELKDFSSTKGQDIQHPVIINSQTAISSTVSQIKNDNFIKSIQSKHLIIRDILVGASSAIVATIISYFIFGIK